MFHDALINVNSLNILSVISLEKEMNDFKKSLQNHRWSFVAGIPELETYVRPLLAEHWDFFRSPSSYLENNNN